MLPPFQLSARLADLCGQIQLATQTAAQQEIQALSQEALGLLREAAPLLSDEQRAQIEQAETLLGAPPTLSDGLGLIEKLSKTLSPKHGAPSRLTPFSPFPTIEARLLMAAGPGSNDPPSSEKISRIIREWKQEISRAVFEVVQRTTTYQRPDIDQEHRRIELLVCFEPTSGKIHDIREIYQKSVRLRLPDGLEGVRFHYDIEDQQLYLEGPWPRRAAFGASVVEQLHGRPLPLTERQIATIPGEGATVIEFPHKIFMKNLEYARWAMRSISVRNMTIAHVPSPSDPFGLPQPEIFVSVALNGSFVGFMYHISEESAATRSSEREIGAPWLGDLARVFYGIWQSPKTGELKKIPTGFVWTSDGKPDGYQPSLLQRTAMERWLNDPLNKKTMAEWKNIWSFP